MRIIQKLIVVAVLLFQWTFVNGQDFYWVKNVPGVTYVDADGFIYKTGGFDVDADFDPGPGEEIVPILSDGEGIFVLKLDPSGSLVWAHSFSTENWSRGHSIITNEAGEVFIWGDYKHYMDADPGEDTYGMPNVGWRDCFLLKLSASGEFVWAKNFGGGWYEFASHLTLDSDENIVLTGAFDYSIDCDPGAGTYYLPHLSDIEESDDFIIKLDPDGNFLWATNIGIDSPPGEYYYAPSFYSLSTDEVNDIYISGRFEGDVNFNPWGGSVYTSAVGEYDGFILKETADGDFDWVRTLEGASGESISSIRKVVADGLGNLYACGHFSNEVSFDGTGSIASSGSDDCFVMKLNALDGSTIWYKTFGSDGYDKANSLCLNPDGTISVLGEFSETVDFDFGPDEFEMSSEGSTDIFLLNVSTDGEFNWVHRLGNENQDKAYYFIGTDADGRTYLSGEIEGTVDFDFSTEEVAMEGDESFEYSSSRLPFLLKLSPCNLSRGDTTYKYLCNEDYTWPETGLSYSGTGIYEAVHESETGCDSVVYLFLTEEEMVAEVTKLETTLSAEPSAALYQWVNCNEDFEPIEGATDQDFEVTENGSYAVIVTDGECTDTSECVIVSDIGFMENGWNDWRVYPNPNDGTFYLDLEPSEKVRLCLYSTIGKKISHSLFTHPYHLRLEFDAPPGCYILEVKDEKDQIQLIRIVKI